MSKKLDVKALVAAIGAAAAVVLYFVSFNTYPAAAVNSTAGTVLGLCAVVLMAACAFGVGSDRVRGVLMLAAGLALVAFFYQFVMGRVTVTADAYFIPVNHPAEEDVSMSQTLAGFAAALLSFVVLTVDAFTGKE